MGLDPGTSCIVKRDSTDSDYPIGILYFSFTEWAKGEWLWSSYGCYRSR